MDLKSCSLTTQIFCIIGIVTAIMILVALGYFLITGICELIDRLKWQYTYKHRFDKPPLAKCYCHDCSHHTTTNRCVNISWAERYTPDNGFCYEAEPKEEPHDNRGN